MGKPFLGEVNCLKVREKGREGASLKASCVKSRYGLWASSASKSFWVWGTGPVFLTKILEGQAIGEGKVWRVGQPRMRPVEEQEANCHIPKDRVWRKAEGRERKGGFRRI